MFYQYQPKGTAEQITVCDIPFSVVKNEDGVVTKLWRDPVNSRFSPGAGDMHLKFDAACDVLFFLGMSTDDVECSDWWGQYETAYDYSSRLFIGDRLMQIRVLFEDRTEETISVIFGVNTWNYNLYYGAHKREKLSTHKAPYQEPFASDLKAKALKDKALKLMENTAEDAEKCTKWVFGYKVTPGKKITEIVLVKEAFKKSNIAISAVTGLRAGQPIDPKWTLVDEDFFQRKAYFSDIYHLAHRLYQFKEDLPAADPKKQMEGFDAPDITFSGAPLADIYTNVYRVNIMDMAYGKVDDEGNSHTSTPGAPNFGSYVGFGTFNEGKDSYSSDIWTRDLGRTLSELTNLGYFKRVLPAAAHLHELLYTKSLRYPIPHWKRIANHDATDENDGLDVKENDGHASVMLFIYTLYRKGAAGIEWLKENEKELRDAADYYIWQKENPKKSNFSDMFYSESEASSQFYGQYDLFSNLISAYALLGYSRIFETLGDMEYAGKLRDLSGDIRTAACGHFTMAHPKYGNVLTDTVDDCWTYEYKRMVDLLIYSDLYGYDMSKEDPELFELLNRTFLAQKELFYAPESGRQMGYGQGYLTQSVIMLDKFEELTECIEAAAMFCYHHTDHSYIVPEGVIVHGSKKYWFRNCDLGNAVQQAEIVKCARLLLGIDDIMPGRGVRLIPRIPNTWDSLNAEEFPVVTSEKKVVPFNFHYSRGMKEGKVTASAGGYAYTADWKGDVDIEYIRMGPFKSADICVTGGEVLEIRQIQDNYFAYVKVE